MGLFDMIKGGVSNAVDAASGFVDGLTGASAEKKKNAKRRQKQAEQARQRAVARAEQAERRAASAKADANVARRQGANLSASNRELAQRSLATARAAEFEAKELRQFAQGIKDDLKSLANSSASVEALTETNEQVAEINENMEEAIKAQSEHNKGVEESIQALNEEAADTTKHLDILTEQINGKGGQMMQLGSDVLPYLRMGLSVLNLERPTNKIAYYMYVASGPFLEGRVDDTTKELIMTALQIWAYWDADGLEGLFRTRQDVLPDVHQAVIDISNATQAQLTDTLALVELAQQWFDDPAVKTELISLGLMPPTHFAGGYPPPVPPPVVP